MLTVVVALEVGGAAVARQNAGAQPARDLPFNVQVVADFESPWAMTFLPDGRMLVTEKAGTLYLVSADGQQRQQVSGVPAVSSEGQGGLMDVVKSPAYSTGGGLVKYGAMRIRQAPLVHERAPVVALAEGHGWGGKLGQWFREVF